ncbi:ABC transporter ATP-binding protein [Bordetella sputigena]|uniref:ABC transporter ATP-binding protein n=1 Tax=Bordetella sputigena TaxID=1416810 RepID=UPI0039F0599F
MLEVQGLSKSFGGIHAVRDIDFRVDAGRIVSLIGPNGAGKTTCFNLVTGFYAPSAGRVRFQGRDVTGARPHEMARMGVVRTFQKTNVLKNLSVRDNLKAAQYLHARAPLWRTFLPGAAQHAAEREIAERAEHIAALMGLQARCDAPAHALSCGELRLLEVGVALGARPRLLMLDEPAAGLNSHEAIVLARLLKTLPGTWVEAILLVEHNMNLVMQVSDHVVVMNFGQKLAAGTPQEIQSNPAVLEAYIGKAA